MIAGAFPLTVRAPACLLLVWLALAGCAARPVVPEPADAAPGADYHLLMAEIALERAQYPIVVQEYVRAAQLSPRPEIAIRATELAFNFGYDAHALRAAGRWLALEPDSALAHLVLARLHLRRHDLGQAVFHAGRLLDRGMPPRDEDYRLLAAELAQDADPGLVTRLLARLTARDPLAGSLQLALGNAALRSGDFALALAAGESAALDDPDWAEPQQLIARALLGQGQVEAALALSARLLAAGPDLELELEHARLLGLAGRPQEARSTLRRLAREHGRQAAIIRLEAFIALETGNLSAAATRFGELLGGGYHVEESFYYLGQLAAAENSTAQALRLYGQIGGGPFLIPARFAIAAIHAGQGDLPTALEELAAFAASHPQHAFEVTEYRAALLGEAGDPEGALAEYGLALEFKPELARLHLARGMLLDQLGRPGEALNALRRALELAPDSPLYQNALGYTLADRGLRLHEANRLVRLAWEQQPESAAVIDSMGWVRYRQGRLPEALDLLEEAWARQRDGEIGAHLGEVLWRLGKRAEARAIWDAALAEFPDSAPLLDTIRRLAR